MTRMCPVCGTEREQIQAFVKWGYPILRCRACGLGATEIADKAGTASIYSAEYFSGGRPDGYADYAGSEAILRKEFRRVLARLAAFRSSGKLLEIGCAYGFFLLEAREKFEVCGLDVSAEAVEFCRKRGLSVECGPLTEDFVARYGPFDVVVMLDVIEHLPEPEETLIRIQRSLREGGHLVITTGDWDSMLSRLLGRAWRLMTPPQHLFFFSRSTLRALLERSGFEVCEMSRPWKVVPLGLIWHQLQRMAGRKPHPLNAGTRLGIPVNLFDAVSVIGTKQR